MKKSISYYFSIFLVILNALSIFIILSSLIIKSTVGDMYQVIKDISTLQSLLISLSSVTISVIIVNIVGIPTAYILSRKKGKTFSIVEMIISLPIVLPPSVAGLALLMTFGRRGILGNFMYTNGIELPFTFFSVVMVQVFIVSPYFIQIVKNGFLTVDESIIESALVFGADERVLVTKIFMPLCKNHIITGMLMCWLRALGEFGATIMFAGNMVGKTQTLSMRIYTLYQSNSNQSITLAAILLFIVAIPFFIVKSSIKNNIE